MRNLFNALLILGLIAGAGIQPAFAHDYHTSITQIDYRPEENTLQVTIKLFSDDLLEALQGHYALKKNLPEFSETEVCDFAKSDFSVSISGKTIDPICIGHEAEMDATFVYLEFTLPNNPKQFTLKNTLLFSLFSDQLNIVHFTTTEEKDSYLFKSTDSIHSFTISS